MLASQNTLVVRYYGATSLPGFGEDAGMIWKGVCERAQIPSTLAAIADAGGTLLNVHPQNSLEELFDNIASEAV
ncbi:hypothetical protein D9M71_813950 [compost metagenome]